jgi:hypothetical protein
MTAHVLDLKFELRLAAFLGAFEGEMFEEVSGAVGLVCFGARAGVDPYADGGCLGVRGVFGCNLYRSLLVWLHIYTSIEHQWQHTVNPLLRVVLSVVLPWLTGVARLRTRPGF